MKLKRSDPLHPWNLVVTGWLVGIGMGQTGMGDRMVLGAIALGLGIIRAIYQYRAYKQSSRSSNEDEVVLTRRST